MRRLALFGLIALIGLAASNAALAGGPRDPQLHRRPADVKMARTLLLTRGDLPAGFRLDKSSNSDSSGPDPACTKKVKINLHSLVETADVSGKSFQRSDGADSVSSSASFFRSPAEAATAIGVFFRPKVDSCLGQLFKQGLVRDSHGKVKNVVVHVIPLAVTSGDVHTRVLDLRVSFTARGLSFQDELVLAFFRRGRVISSLMLNTLGGLNGSESAQISAAAISKLERLPQRATR